MKCNRCGEEHEDESVFTEVSNGDMICTYCLDNYYALCNHCDKFNDRDYMYLTYNEELICEDCRDEWYVSCIECDYYVNCNNVSEDSYGDPLCPNCVGSNQSHRSNPQNDDKYESKNFGDIIKSKRTFGIELELLTNDKLSGEIDANFGIKGDGSLDCSGTNFHDEIEIVSPVLRGKKGEQAVLDLCASLKTKDVGVNKSCGLHVHLGAKDFLQMDSKIIAYSELDEFKKKDEDELYTPFFFPAEIYVKFTDKFNTHDLDEIIARMSEGGFRHSTFETYQDGFIYKDDKITEKDVNDKTMVIMKPLDDNIEKLKNLLKFYMIFEPVIMCSQPRSRRDSNSYSAPINNSFCINDIDKIDSYDKFDQYWYKTSDKRRINNRKQDKYSSARYYSFNFHALLCGGNGGYAGFKTLEIRLHSGTKNAKKILYWTAFHQIILDKIAQCKITSEDLEKASGLFSVLDKMNLMFKFLELDDDTELAIKKRIEKFGLNDRRNQEDHIEGVEDGELMTA